MARAMTIGRLAKAAAVNVETIRYYQRVGLIDEPRKPQGGQRSYPPEALHRVAFIRRAQHLGFTLADVRELLAHSGDREAVIRIAQSRHAKLAVHAEELAAMSQRLKRLLDRSRRSRGRDEDPIIAALAGEAPASGTAR
jgi:MerR family mercuric resistance operon transcriptional regulator